MNLTSIYKAISIGIIVAALLTSIWLILPIRFRYYSKIAAGDTFSKNLLKYKASYGKLPDENQWEILASLNPLTPFESFYPEFHKTDDNSFTLIYIEGFDPPFLTFDSKLGKWELK